MYKIQLSIVAFILLSLLEYLTSPELVYLYEFQSNYNPYYNM